MLKYIFSHKKAHKAQKDLYYMRELLCIMCLFVAHFGWILSTKLQIAIF